jgi:hypothetical protein
MMKVMLYSQATEFAASIVQKLVSDQVLLEIYRRIDSVRTRDQIVTDVIALKLNGGGRSAVFRKFTHLIDLGIIQPAALVGVSGVFQKSAVDEGLRIEKNPEYLRAVKGLAKLP